MGLLNDLFNRRNKTATRSRANSTGSGVSAASRARSPRLRAASDAEQHKDVRVAEFSAPVHAQKPQASDPLPQLSVPKRPIAARTSTLGKALELDAAVAQRRDLRQLRRFYDESAIGDDTAAITKWAAQQFGAETHTPIVHALLAQARSDALSHASAPASEVGPQSPIEQLHQGEVRLASHLFVVGAYWGTLAHHLDHLENVIEGMRTRGKSAADIVAAPELKRYMRALGNEQALLKKDVAQVQHVLERYAAGIMSLRERSPDAQLVAKLVSGVRLGANLRRADAEAVVAMALSPHVELEKPSSAAMARKVATMRKDISNALPRLPKGRLTPSSAAPAAHLVDATVIERLARLALGAPGVLNVRVEHPLRAGEVLEVTSSDDMDPLRTHFVHKREFVGAMLAQVLLPVQGRLGHLLSLLRDPSALTQEFAIRQSLKASIEDEAARPEPDEAGYKGPKVRVLPRRRSRT